MQTKEQEKHTSGSDLDEIKKLILYNSQHIWDDVIYQLRKATGYDILHCEQIAMIAHTKGKAIVKTGEYEELYKIEKVLKEINLITEIQ